MHWTFTRWVSPSWMRTQISLYLFRKAYFLQCQRNSLEKAARCSHCWSKIQTTIRTWFVLIPFPSKTSKSSNIRKRLKRRHRSSSAVCKAVTWRPFWRTWKYPWRRRLEVLCQSFLFLSNAANTAVYQNLLPCALIRSETRDRNIISRDIHNLEFIHNYVAPWFLLNETTMLKHLSVAYFENHSSPYTRHSQWELYQLLHREHNLPANEEIQFFECIK